MSTRVLFVTLHVAMNHRRYIGCTVYWVVPFIHTGYICNVAGGRLPPLRLRWWMVPIIRTGYIRNIAGVAPLRLLFPQCFTPYRILISLALWGEPASPKGSSCTVLLGMENTARRSKCQPSTANVSQVQPNDPPYPCPYPYPMEYIKGRTCPPPPGSSPQGRLTHPPNHDIIEQMSE